jgi:DWNN domain/Zinc knuckle
MTPSSYYVYFRFKSVTDYQALQVDHTGIDLFSLKRAIVKCTSLQKGAGFNLCIFRETLEEYLEDTDIVPCGSSVIVKRVPPGSKRSSLAHRIKQQQQEEEYRLQEQQHEQEHQEHQAMIRIALSEEDALVALHKQASKLSRVSTLTQRGPQVHKMSRPIVHAAPPLHYVCKRCNVAGHFIQDCPTNGDERYDIKRSKLVVGVPSTMLDVVSDAAAAGGLVDCRGRRVKLRSSSKPLSCGTRTAVADMPFHLNCPFCKYTIEDAVTIPCCRTAACDACAREALTLSGMQCPLCLTPGMIHDTLVPNLMLRQEVEAALYQADSAEQVAQRDSAEPLAPTEVSVPVIEQLQVAEPVEDDSEMDDDFGPDVY